MQVTWWIPGTLAGKRIASYPAGQTSEPMLFLASPSHGELRISIVFRGLIFDPAPDLGRQGFLDLLLDVGDEADRSGHDRQPAAHLPRKVELAENRADGAGCVDRQLAPVGSARLLSDELHQLDVASRQPVFEGDREQAR